MKHTVPIVKPILHFRLLWGHTLEKDVVKIQETDGNSACTVW